MSWLEKTLDPIATKHLKQWIGLVQPADPSQLYVHLLSCVWHVVTGSAMVAVGSAFVWSSRCHGNEWKEGRVAEPVSPCLLMGYSMMCKLGAGWRVGGGGRVVVCLCVCVCVSLSYPWWRCSGLYFVCLKFVTRFTCELSLPPFSLSSFLLLTPSLSLTLPPSSPSPSLPHSLQRSARPPWGSTGTQRVCAVITATSHLSRDSIRR